LDQDWNICMCPSLAIAIIDFCLNTYFIINGTTFTNVLELSITHLTSTPNLFISLVWVFHTMYEDMEGTN